MVRNNVNLAADIRADDKVGVATARFYTAIQEGRCLVKSVAEVGAIPGGMQINAHYVV